MAETRIALGHRVIKPAKIEYGGYKIPCTIRDLSITGAPTRWECTERS